MDWDLAIERNREALLRIVAALFAMAGLTESVIRGPDPRIATLPRHLRCAVLRVLRPAESAVRRLVIIAARNMRVEAHPVRAVILGPAPRQAKRRRCERPPSVKVKTVAKATNLSLPLIDPLKRFHFGPVRKKPKGFPRISIIGVTEPRPIPEYRIPSPGDPVDAAPLCRRLHALRRALDDLDGQAKRLARWRARRDAGLLRAKRLSPMRPGWPPGFRRRPIHAVDDVLRECHALAVQLQRDDTS